MCKATGWLGAQDEYGFTVYVKNGKNYDVYRCRAKHDENGELVKTSIKEIYSKAWIVPTPANVKNLPEKLHHNTTTHVDKYGNWIFAGDTWKDGLMRKLYYYDDGYDAAEDKAVDEVCQKAVSINNKAMVSDAISSIPGMIVALLIKICWLLLVVYLILLLFKREWAYRPFNRYAGRRITPYGLFCKAQLHGFVPVALLFLPSLILVGSVTKHPESKDATVWAVMMLLGLALCVGYCCLFVKRKSAEIGRKNATAIIAFAVWSGLPLWQSLPLLSLRYGLP